jgi:ribulose kinase
MTFKTDVSKVTGSKAKDFVKLWIAKYGIKVGYSYKPKWARECAIMRQLMAKYSNIQLRQIIDFAFSGDSSTAYIANQGYPIALLPSQLNRWNVKLFKPAQSISEHDLRLEQSCLEDSRTSFIYKSVVESKPNRIIQHIKNEQLWHILFAKMEKQLGYVPDKFRIYFDLWKSGVPVTRTPRLFDDED